MNQQPQPSDGSFNAVLAKLADAKAARQAAGLGPLTQQEIEAAKKTASELGLGLIVVGDDEAEQQEP